MELSVLSTTITEPVTVDEVKDMMGYTEDDQDERIRKLIRVARQWIENKAAISCVSKSYKAYFEKGDRDSSGWYELPVAPVLAAPAITVSSCGVSTTFEQKGLRRVYIRPAAVYSTLTGGSSDNYYVEVTFQAGESNETANECIRRIVATMFNEPQDGAEVSVSRLTYDTLTLIGTINNNTGF